MILDFTEIPSAIGGALESDEFEDFACEFLILQGYEIVEGPDRGPDGGRDMIVRRKVESAGKQKIVRYLVSCKHKAHSRGNIGPSDEQSNLHAILRRHCCKGFIAFYSKGVTANLGAILDGLGADFDVIRYRPKRIETELLATEEGCYLARRTFPMSYAAYVESNPLYSERAINRMAQRARKKFDKHHVDIQIRDDQAWVGFIRKDSGIEAARPGETQLRFDAERDKDLIGAFEHLDERSEWVDIPAINIVSMSLPAEAGAAFLERGAPVAGMYLTPLWNAIVLHRKLVIELPEGDLVDQYGPLLMRCESNRDGIMAFSNSSQNKLIVFRFSVSDDEYEAIRPCPQFEIDYRNHSVNTALEAYRFASKLCAGSILRLVDEGGGDFVVECTLTRDFDVSKILGVVESVAVIQSYKDEEWSFAEQSLNVNEKKHIVECAELIAKSKRSLGNVSFDFDLSREDGQEFARNILASAAAKSGGYALRTFNIDPSTVFNILGHEVEIGPTLTLISAMRLTDESIGRLQNAMHLAEESITVEFAQIDGQIAMQYSLSSITVEDYLTIKELLPEASFSQVKKLCPAQIRRKAARVGVVGKVTDEVVG